MNNVLIRRYTVSCHLGVEFLKYLYTENIMNNMQTLYVDTKKYISDVTSLSSEV